VPQVVSDEELPSAATLSGLQFNISGIVGPAFGGLLIPMAGANFVFAVNAACFFLVVLAVRQWKQPSAPAKLPSERFFESFGTVIRYTRNAPDFQVVLARNFLFALFISAVPALMPVVGLKVLQLSSSNLGLLFTSMGAGSVLGAVFIIPWLRARFSSDCLASLANSLLALVYVFMAFVRQTELFFVVAALAGVGWTLSASELWVAAQRTTPAWARGRLNAMIIMISQGAMALGGVIWGSAATISRSKLHFALGGGSVPRKSGSGAPAFDQCCRIKRSRPDSTHRRIGRRLNGSEKASPKSRSTCGSGPRHNAAHLRDNALCPFQVGRGDRCGARARRLFADDGAPLFESGNAGRGASILADCPLSNSALAA
jgi:hypothetical protein